MRLDKYIRIVMNVSRVDAKKIINNSEVLVNNKLIKKAETIINEETDIITINKEKLEYIKQIYIMMNKPSGYICSTTGDKTVFDLLADYKGYDLHIVGRLDIDTVGLLIITNDGNLVHKLTSPKSECPKKYYLEVEGQFKETDVIDCLNGFVIDDGKGNLFKTKKAILEIIDINKAYITITEGKFHQVKKMMNYLNKEVVFLRRESINELVLDYKLALGEYRLLNDEEIKMLKKGT